MYQDRLFGPDEMPPIIEKITPRVQDGDLWACGDHRVLCGDATCQNDVVRLLQGERAKLSLQDPPYGLQARGIGWGFGDGKKRGKAARKLFAPVRGNDQNFDPAHLLDSGEIVVIWGAQYFADKLPASPAWIIWDKREGITSNDMSDGEAAWVSQGNTLRIIRHYWDGFLRKSERGIERLHPTQKPIFVISDVIKRYTDPGDLVTDWYAGSGTTLLCAEILKRRAAVIEIEPHYCDVILARYETSTGIAPRLLSRIEEQEKEAV